MVLLSATVVDIACAGSATVTPVKEAYITSQVADMVAIVRLDDLRVVARIKVEGKPAGVVVSPDKRRVYVSVPEAKGIVVIDADARKILRKVHVGSGACRDHGSSEVGNSLCGRLVR